MGAAVVAGARLALAVGLDQEPAEVGDRAVDFVGLGRPPGAHRRVERIAGRQPADDRAAS
jgi:hypothetical protein